MKGLNVMAMIGLLLVVMVPKAMQSPVDRRLGRVADTINEPKGPFIGLVLSSTNDEERLLSSGYFVPDHANPPLTVAGRKFNIGTFNGVPAVYVIARSPLAYVSLTVQILVDKFHLIGIIDYGSAGTVSKSLAVGDVAVLKASAFTGVWSWKKWEKSTIEGEDVTTLTFGDYNSPKPGDNKLASVEYQKVLKYTPSNAGNETFWFPAHQPWYEVASQLKDVILDNCVKTICCLGQSNVVTGVKGSSADVLLSNEAYAHFLNHNLGVSTVDRKSAATASTAIANGVAHIVFRAATNRPGEDYNQNQATLAAQNTLKLVATFAERIYREPRQQISYY